MQVYRVVWETEIEADTPHEAAERALAILRTPDSPETVFRVFAHGDTEPVIVDATLPGED